MLTILLYFHALTMGHLGELWENRVKKGPPLTVKKLSTFWRFLLPVLLVLIIAPFVLSKQQTIQEMANIEEDAHAHVLALTHVFRSSDIMMSEQVNMAMRLMINKINLLGDPSLSNNIVINGKAIPELMLGKSAQANHADLVDSISNISGGTATLFVKSGDDFVRIATNVRGHDGKRAIGTLLDPHGVAIKSLREGKSFQGIVDILGAPYFARYEPIKDADGETIAVCYVGYRIDMQVIRDSIESARFLKNGFAALIDSNDQLFLWSDHLPKSYIEKVLRNSSSDWKIIEEPIPSWNFKVVIAYPILEAQEIGLSKAFIAIITGSSVSLILILLIFWQLRHLILDPIGGDPTLAINVVKKIAEGNLEDDHLKARPNSLLAHVIAMRAKLSALVNTLRDNSERMSLSASVFEHTNDGIFIADSSVRIIDINPAFTAYTGYHKEEVIGKHPAELGFSADNIDIFQQVNELGEWQGEAQSKRKNGETFTAQLEAFVVRDSNNLISQYVGVFSDITSSVEHQHNLEHLAYYDALTQLPNRTLLADRLKQAMARASRSSELLTVCLFDLDGFKPVNDNLGHEAGDRLLVQIAGRVKACMRETDTVARLGGDEFVVLLCGLNTIEESQQTLDRLLGAINTPFEINDNTVRVSASMGYTLYPVDNSEPDTLLRHADQAMYQAKTNGGNAYFLFDAAQDKHTRDLRQTRQQLEEALKNGELQLHYQPKVNIRKGTVVGVEALIRWRNSDQTLQLPAEFLPIIENTDFSHTLGEWCIREAIRQAGLWRKDGLNLKVAVNISPRHITRTDFPKRLEMLLQSFPEFPPNMLELEVTESAAIEDMTVVAQVMNSCKLLGVSFTLDDFGVGFSSLTYLRRLPVANIKIDRSFVRDMLHDSEDLSLIAGIISLSREFDRQVVAEGVETDEHVVQLLKMGCQFAQGFGIGFPMPASQITPWVKNFKPSAQWSEVLF